MNVNYSKTISYRIFNFVFPVFVILLVQLAVNAQTFQLGGSWKMYNDKNVKFDKEATITQNGENLSIDNGYGANSTGVLSGNTLKTSDGLTGTVSGDGTQITWSNKFVWTLRGAFQPANDLSGSWKMYGKDGLPYDKNAVITQNGTSVTLNNGYGEEATVSFLDSKLMVRSWRLNGTVSADGKRIDWSNGFYWTKNSATTTADSGIITRMITIKNNAGFAVKGYLYQLTSSGVSSLVAETSSYLNYTESQTFGSGVKIPKDNLAEFTINLSGDGSFGPKSGPVFKAILPRNKDYTTFCYEVTGTYYVPAVKTCDGSPTYESKHISFKNEAGYTSTMSLTYYPTGGSTAKTADTFVTTPGFQTKLYLPLDANTDKPMTLKVEQTSDLGNSVMLTKNIDLSSFDEFGSTCYKVWGSIFSKKINPCSANTSARTIKLKNNGAYQAKMQVIYDDNGTSKMVSSNPLEVLESDTVEVPVTASTTPIKIRFLAYNKEFNTTTASANFTGELCYKLEGTAWAATAATCDDTVGDTTGETRQIRFQNDAGYDAQMMVSFFVDEVINGNKIPMAKLLSTGMINGLGGKFRLVTIPKNTSKGMPITISLQGNATVKNNVWSTTLSDDFAASPQPCFKVWGTALNPDGGKCNQ